MICYAEDGKPAVGVLKVDPDTEVYAAVCEHHLAVAANKREELKLGKTRRFRRAG